MTYNTRIYLADDDKAILKIAGTGSVARGVREMAVIYRDWWALGYRPTVPVKFFVRQYAKKKGPRRTPKEMALTARPEYNPGQDGQ